MAQTDPARRLSPAAGVGETVRAQDGGRNSRTVGRDADARVKKIAGAEIRKSLFGGPPENFAPNVGRENLAVGRNSVVDLGICRNVEHAERCRGLRRREY